jgi:hypothetical protein
VVPPGDDQRSVVVGPFLPAEVSGACDEVNLAVRQSVPEIGRVHCCHHLVFAALDDAYRCLDPWQQRAENGKLVGVGLHVGDRFGELVSVVAGDVVLANLTGWADAANSVADVPMSGATTCGLSSSRTSAIRMMKSPIAFGFISASRRSDPPNPGRSTAVRRAASASRGHICSNAYMLSGQGLSSITSGDHYRLWPNRIDSPSTVIVCG